jgi:hypothetical protein
MVRTAGRLQIGALCIGTTGVSKRGGWAYPAEQGFAADALQRPLRSRFRARLSASVDMTSGVKS